MTKTRIPPVTGIPNQKMNKIHSGTKVLLRSRSARFVVLMAVFCLYAACCSARGEAQLTIATNGKSTFTIVIPADAPTSVISAAHELQQDIRESTGALLSIQKGSAAVHSPFISLGNTSQFTAAKIDTSKVKEEGFCIVSRNDNLYIWGIDTPDGKWTAQGGTSNGTANGIYTFLEDYLDVRWLMPGELGRAVPSKSTFVVPAIDRIENPQFISRKLPYLVASRTMVNDSVSVHQWEDRQKLGFSINLGHKHNWVQTVPPELYAEHPDFFALLNGTRKPEDHRYKLETTNPALIQYFAQKAVETLKTDERPETFSLSPSDYRGWSESEASKALYDPPIGGHPSMSSLVLKFYHDVAQIVQREYPQGKLAGYIYNDYLYPPVQYPMQLPDNFIPVIAPSSVTYGYRLYHAENRKTWQKLMDAWAKVAPPVWVYYDVPNTFNLWRITSEDDRMSGTTGIVSPAAPQILNFIFKGMVKAHIKGAYLFGSPSWSNAAMSNYIMAKMMWNPSLDAYALQRDWLNHAYGEAAGAAMVPFYRKLESIFQDYSKDKVILSRPNDKLFNELYGKYYTELEKLFLVAKNQPMTTRQQERFQLLEDNMIVLQWRLRNAGFLPADFHSVLARSDAQINALLHQQNDAFPEFPEAIIGWKQWTLERMPSVDVQLRDALPEPLPKSTFPASVKQLLLLYADQPTEIQLLPTKVHHGSLFATYAVTDDKGKQISAGLLDEAHPAQISLKAHQLYYLYFPSRPGTSFQVTLTNTALAKGFWQNGKLELQRQQAPVYLYQLPESQLDVTAARQHILITREK